MKSKSQYLSLGSRAGIMLIKFIFWDNFTVKRDLTFLSG